MRGGRTPRAVAALLAATALAATAGCSGDPEQPAEEPTPTYRLEPREVRPDERPIHVEGSDGDTEYEVIGLTTGIEAITGSHAEWRPKGRLIRLRVAVTNRGRSTALFNANRQQLVLADGATRKPDSQAMLIKRQPAEFDLGATVRVEFDLYYDAPVDARPKALRAFGGGTLIDLKDEKGTDIPLK